MNEGNTYVMNAMFRWTASIRGSTGYWKSEIKRGYAFARFLEYFFDQMPTVFMTISAAEMHWPWMHRLYPDSGRYLGAAGEELSEKEMYRLRSESVVNNPGITSRAYQLFVHGFVRDVLCAHAGWEDYMLRNEFAARGMAHVHCIGRIAGAPTISNILDALEEVEACGACDGPHAQLLLKFYKENVNMTAWHPEPDKDKWPVAPEGYSPEGSTPSSSLALRTSLCDVPADDASMRDHLANLLNRTMMHECNNYCLRTVPKTKEKFCRVGYGPESESKRACECPECASWSHARSAADALASTDPPACQAQAPPTPPPTTPRPPQCRQRQTQRRGRFAIGR